MGERRPSPMLWARRASQIAFASLFLWLFLETTYHPINEVGGPVTLFFDLDPLVLLSVFVATGVVSGSLLLALGTVAATLAFGRVFCGFVCPLGTIHAFVSRLRRASVRERRLTGGYSDAQRIKYPLLVALLAAAALGMNAVGWLDPLSLLYRSLATAFYPAATALVRDVFTFLYEKDPGIGTLKVTAVSEPVYDILRRHVLPAEQPHFLGAFLLGGMFIALLALDFRLHRFWCRVLCPLGALLGLLARRPLLVVSRDQETCSDCGLCRAHCHGGADPHDAWRSSECLYCWNCVDSCPKGSIHIGIALSRPTPGPASTPDEVPS